MYFLLILSLKSILGSIIGSSFYNWFQGTTAGIWFQKKVDRFMQHFAEKYDLELAKKDAKFRKQYIGNITGRDISRQHYPPEMYEGVQRWSNYFYGILSE